MKARIALFALLTCAWLLSIAQADPKKPRLLLIGQGPDGHPAATHEYYAGLKILEQCLAPAADKIDIQQVRADGDWKDGPELLGSADGVVLSLAEGAKWVQADARRYEAFTKLAARGGGIVGLHWATGTRDAKNIDGYKQLLGGVHGGDDRKYKVLETSVEVAKHPIARGVKDFTIKDEFYYQIKFVDHRGLVPVLKAKIDGEPHTVAWAWDRDDGGRSFGFTGLHFHENWRREEYRRVVAQAVLWTLKIEANDDMPGKVAEEDYKVE